MEVCFLLAMIVFPEIFYYEIFDDSVLTGKWVQQSFRLSICVVLNKNNNNKPNIITNLSFILDYGLITVYF